MPKNCLANVALFDIIFGISLLIAGFSGFKRGFIVEIISLLAFFIGLFLALKLAFPIALRFFGAGESFWIVALIIFLLVFLLVIYAATSIAKAIKAGLEPTGAGTLDSLLGIVIAVAKWIFIVSILLWVVESLDMDVPNEWVDNSYLYMPLASVAPIIVEWVSSVIPFFHDILDTMDAPPRRV